ncbi:MAG: hypothetical protein K2Q32_07475 [Alphaproteobacteria bacterium]|nr:hypothetical protein [Alphaproteobacteria bacterium]
MTQPPISLSRALNEHMDRTGKSLADIEREAFHDPERAHPLMSGIGYLQLVKDGYHNNDVQDNLYGGRQTTDGGKALAKYLIKHRGEVGVDTTTTVSAHRPPTYQST